MKKYIYVCDNKSVSDNNKKSERKNDENVSDIILRI